MAIMHDQSNELVLTESRTMRAQTAGRVEVLDKVKALALLPDGMHATTDIVASYYEVDAEAIKSLVRRHREELEENGLRKLTGDDLREFVRVSLTPANEVSSKTRTLNLFTRRAILNVGQLLTESEVAKKVRAYLLNVEEAATAEQRAEAVDEIRTASIGEARLRMLKAAEGLVDPTWLESKVRVTVARGLGDEPEINPLDVPLYVPDYLKDKGLDKAQVKSAESWFGRHAVKICRQLGVKAPDERQSEAANGSIRRTRAWTERHRPVFDATWSRHYAAKYDVQQRLGDAS